MSTYYSNPVMTLAGIMPTTPEIQWATSYPNPDAYNSKGNGHRSVGPSMSIAGIMPGTPEMEAWWAKSRIPVDQEAIFAQQCENVRQFGLCGSGRAVQAAKVVELPVARPAAQRKAA